MKPVEVIEGSSSIVLAMPHSGTWLPDEEADKLNETGKLLADTDWHIPKLYEGLLSEATIVKANFHRYVIDANRDPAGKSLYPGQNTTSLCPTTDFEGKPIWNEGAEPAQEEITKRIEQFHTPYHQTLNAALQRVKKQHGYAILYDCHSIQSQLPYLFEGLLPALNIGTNDGQSCSPILQQVVHDVCESSEFSTVLNGRFKGGWTTRHYGQPDQRIHAIQMEITQASYMHETLPFDYAPDKAQYLHPVLKELLSQLANTPL